MASLSDPTTSGTTRLDRLLILLDTGSNPAIRKTAARQLGDIAKLHPGELLPLLNRVKRFLRSKVWETRVAAAQAVGAIAENVAHPSVDQALESAHAVLRANGIIVPFPQALSAVQSAAAPSEDTQTPALAFDSFNVVQVLENGAPLLASGGQEYDVAVDTAKSFNERIARQRQNLQRRLGLDGCEQFMDMRDVIQDEDLVPEAGCSGSRDRPRDKQGAGAAPGKKDVQELVAHMKPGSLNRSLSAREQNFLKRKAKALSKGPSWRDVDEAEPTSKRAKEETAAQDEVPLEDVADEGAGASGGAEEGRWPFTALCEELLLDMFDPVWEIRHGSIMALREILSVQSGSAGVVAPPLQQGALLGTEPGTGEPSPEADKTTDRSAQAHALGEGSNGGSSKEQTGEGQSGQQLVKGSLAWNLIESSQQSQAANLHFQQDCAVRLLCIFALDRFGDYVSDQVVAPVRETCAQALGALAKVMPPPMIHHTVSVLVQMQGRPEWEVRHGCLLGIKYLVAVRKELVSELLPQVLPVCISGLEDPDDDVRAVAAEALAPAAAAVAEGSGRTVADLLSVLWDILLELDDLSPSTSSVMHLLAELYGQPQLAEQASQGRLAVSGRPLPELDLNAAQDLKTELDGLDDELEDELDNELPPLGELAPRLWPLMRHNIAAVRHAAMRTLERLLEAGGTEEQGGGGGGGGGGARGAAAWVGPILEDALRLVLQNLMLETEEPIRKCSQRVWRLLLQAGLQIGEAKLEAAAGRHIPSWLKLMATPSGTPLEAALMLAPGQSATGAGKIAAPSKQTKASHQSRKAARLGAPTGESTSAAVVGAEGESAAVAMRLAAAEAFGQLAALWPSTSFGTMCRPLMDLLRSQHGVHRQVAAMAVAGWFRALRTQPKSPSPQTTAEGKALLARLSELLACSDPAQPTPGNSSPYAEQVRAYAKLRAEAQALLSFARGIGATPWARESVETMGVEAAVELATSLEGHVGTAGGGGGTGHSSDVEMLESARQCLLTTAGYVKAVQNNLHTSVLASVAGALVWTGALPGKLNPIIQPLMAAIKREKEEALQRVAAVALADLVVQCQGRKPGPNDKLLRNLCTLTCADPSETPTANESNADVDLAEEGDPDESHSKPRPGPNAAAVQTAKQALAEREQAEGSVTRRGAELALQALSEEYGTGLLSRLPRLWECMTEALPPTEEMAEEASKRPAWMDRPLPAVEAEAQALVNNLQVVRSLARSLHCKLHGDLLRLLPAVLSCTRHQHAAVRRSAARCVAAMARAATQAVMGAVLARALPMLADTSSEASRRGAAAIVRELVGAAGTELVAYAGLLVVPLLGRLSDPSPKVRQSVTSSFATLVPLLPLARGMGPPPLLDAAMAAKAEEDAHFLEQLLDNKRVEDYKLHVPLKVTLRRYQQEGINWLAFLTRFRLHGILCDDMGLGKTLQSSAMVASDTALRAATFVRTGSPDSAPLPSLVVCPPTLVAHWAYEIEKFLPEGILRPLQYAGPAKDRMQLRARLSEHNLVITSYEVLRADVGWLEKTAWNFCILDEGHTIKSAKSRVAQAAKCIRAEHRLVLSGTPLQNNVLELWALFDFLMPGFLGTERQFHATYGKALAAARDPKCTAKQAEAGVLALEALHKQVMPFMLRRTKEQVLKDLPPKIIQDRYCDVSPLQLALYEQFSQSTAKNQVADLVGVYGAEAEPAAASSASKGGSTHVFQALQYLRKLCSHPLLVLDEMGSEQARAMRSQAEAVGEPMDLHALEHSPKLVALQEILLECGIGLGGEAEQPLLAEAVAPHRVLVFAQLKGFLDIIEKDLLRTHMRTVSYLRLDGSVEASKRFDIVRQFNSDPTIDVLLLTTHVGGLGLNLTAADTVVFMEHDWNPMRDLQAMDRAHRLGQQRSVSVHRLIMRDTLEEKMMGLQRFKLSVANTVVNADNASLTSMDTTQLLDLFNVPQGVAGKVTRPSREAGLEDAEDAAAGAGGAPKGKGLKAMLNGLEELWGDAQYAEEYDLNAFVSRLKG